MDTELKAKWVAALRSGEYKQGTKYLVHDHHYCCLGVLRELMVKSDGEYPLLKTIIPVKILWDFVDLNDNRGQTFAQIADYIEAHL